MGQTLSNYDAVLKEFYLGDIVDALPKEIPLYDEFAKDSTQWSGNKVSAPVRVRRNFGRGARADGGTMPTAGNQTYQDQQTTAKNNYMRIQVTGPTMAASRDNKGAFAKAVASEIKYGTPDFLDDIDRQICAGDGTGEIAEVETTGTVTSVEVKYAGASTSSVTAEPGTRWIKTGMTLNIGTAAQHAAATADYVTVTSVTDRDTFVIAETAIVAADIITQAGAAAVLANSYGNEIEGIAKAMITTGTYQNIVVDTYPDWKAQVLSNSSVNRTLSLDLMQQAIDEAEEAGGRIDLIATHFSMRREYLDLVVPDKRYLGPKNLDGGYVGELDFNGIKMKFLRNFTYNTIAFLNRSSWTLCEQGKPNWFDLDGNILSRVANSDAVEALLVYYANLRCEAPCRNAYLKDITVTLRAT